ncbi:MAG: MFS transporter [Firmicutes bacterium]|nr:MFS transporter [Bacillota bacterium]
MKQNNAIKCTQNMYVLHSVLEYFISMLVSGSYLATLTSYVGISDGLTGILSASISLGCLFQLFSVFLKRGSVKKTVIILTMSNQLLFLMLYIIPLSGMENQPAVILFVVSILAAYLLSNMASPLKTNWFISMVEEHKRGVYSAKVEIFSLITGIFFTFIMGSTIDYFKAQEQMETAFIVCGITLFGLMVINGLALLLSAEPEKKAGNHASPLKEMLSTFRNKNVLKLTGLYSLWYIANFISTPFYGTYQIKELGFSLQFVSVLTMIYSIVRSGISPVWGKYADKHSFGKMIRLCFCVAGTAFFINMFTVPANGRIFFTLYFAIFAGAIGGINNAITNLVFEMVPEEIRSNALALTKAISGMVGFSVTLVGGWLVEYIQGNGNMFLGQNVYAQQIMSGIAFVFVVICIVYVTLVIKPKK